MYQLAFLDRANPATGAVRYVNDDTVVTVSSIARLPTGVWWVTNVSESQLMAAKLDGKSLLSDVFFGCKLQAIIDDVGLMPDVDATLIFLDRLLQRVVELTPKLQARTLIEHFAQPVVRVERSPELRRVIAQLCHPSCTSSDTSVPNSGGIVIPLRKYQPTHISQLLSGGEVPVEESVELLPDIEIHPHRFILYHAVPSANTLYDSGPYSKPWLTPSECRDYGITQKTARALAAHQLRDAPWTKEPFVQWATNRPSHDAADVDVANIRLSGSLALSYAASLHVQAKYRALMQGESAQAAFLHASERALTLGYAHRVQEVIRKNSLSEELQVVRWRAGTVWVQANIADPERLKTVITATCIATELLHPNWSKPETHSPRVRMGVSLLQNRTPAATLLGMRALGRVEATIVT